MNRNISGAMRVRIIEAVKSGMLKQVVADKLNVSLDDVKTVWRTSLVGKNYARLLRDGNLYFQADRNRRQGRAMKMRLHSPPAPVKDSP